MVNELIFEVVLCDGGHIERVGHGPGEAIWAATRNAAGLLGSSIDRAGTRRHRNRWSADGKMRLPTLLEVDQESALGGHGSNQPP
jgi:hypothetical protein